jgi:hypothetical protein
MEAATILTREYRGFETGWFMGLSFVRGNEFLNGDDLTVASLQGRL